MSKISNIKLSLRLEQLDEVNTELGRLIDHLEDFVQGEYDVIMSVRSSKVVLRVLDNDCDVMLTWPFVDVIDSLVDKEAGSTDIRALKLISKALDSARCRIDDRLNVLKGA